MPKSISSPPFAFLAQIESGVGAGGGEPDTGQERGDMFSAASPPVAFRVSPSGPRLRMSIDGNWEGENSRNAAFRSRANLRSRSRSAVGGYTVSVRQTPL